MVYITSKNIQDILQLIMRNNAEACGIMTVQDEHLIPFIDSFGESEGPRKMCNYTRLSKYVWHTHTKDSISYPSAEDYVAMIKLRDGVTVKTSIVFTFWGIWELYSANKLKMGDRLREALINGIKSTEYDIYSKSGRGRGAVEIEVVNTYIANVIKAIEKLLPNLGYKIRFTPWKDINNYVLQLA
jgi:hypothetical protein